MNVKKIDEFSQTDFDQIQLSSPVYLLCALTKLPCD